MSSPWRFYFQSLKSADGSFEQREIEVMQNMKHPNILSAIDLFEDNDHIYFITEM